MITCLVGALRPSKIDKVQLRHSHSAIERHTVTIVSEGNFTALNHDAEDGV